MFLASAKIQNKSCFSDHSSIVIFCKGTKFVNSQHFSKKGCLNDTESLEKSVFPPKGVLVIKKVFSPKNKNFSPSQVSDLGVHFGGLGLASVPLLFYKRARPPGDLKCSPTYSPKLLSMTYKMYMNMSRMML